MISKQTKGKGFRGALDYLLGVGKEHSGRGAIIGGNMAGRAARELAHEFGQLRKLRPSLGRAVSHFSLSLPPDDRRPDDAEWAAIAQRFIQEMGFVDCPYVVVRHDDTDHFHIHILASRINLSGGVVSDRNDYRRAEAIVRRIEQDHGFRAVPVVPKNKTNQRRKTMEDETSKPANELPQQQDDPAHLASDTIHSHMQAQVLSCHAGDQPSERKRRDMRRAIHDPDYERLIRSIFGADLKHVHRHPRGAAIYTTDGGRIQDEGDKLTAYNMEHRLAARRMVELAIAKGWTSIVFSGPEEFVREAMREAMSQGLLVQPNGPDQKAIMQEILDAGRGAVGFVPEPTPETKPEPEPLSDQPMSLAERLRRRREGLATPQQHPRGPVFK